MVDKKNVISKYDLFVTIVLTVTGTSLFFYPRLLSEKVGTDGWFVIILTGALLVPLLYILCKSIKVNGYRRFTLMLEDVFGIILGKIIAMYVVVAAVFIISVEMRIFTEVVKMYLLDKTPAEFIILLMILVGSILVRGEIESVIKFNGVVFWIMFIPMILVIPFVLFDADFTNIFPILNHAPIEYIKAVRPSLYSFVGLGVIYMVLPLLKEKRGAFRVAVKSIVFLVVFYSIMVLATLFVFPSRYNASLLWPTITMISTVNIQGTFLERWEGFVMIFWILFYFAKFVNLFCFSSEIVKDVFRLEDMKLSVAVTAPFIYIIALYAENIAEVYALRDRFMPYIDIIIIGLIPIALIIGGLGKTRRIRDES